MSDVCLTPSEQCSEHHFLIRHQWMDDCWLLSRHVYIYSQTCIKRSPLGQGQSGLL